MSGAAESYEVWHDGADPIRVGGGCRGMADAAQYYAEVMMLPAGAAIFVRPIVAEPRPTLYVMGEKWVRWKGQVDDAV